jgi:hypothetical protein
VENVIITININFSEEFAVYFRPKWRNAVHQNALKDRRGFVRAVTTMYPLFLLCHMISSGYIGLCPAHKQIPFFVLAPTAVERDRTLARRLTVTKHQWPKGPQTRDIPSRDSNRKRVEEAEEFEKTPCRCGYATGAAESWAVDMQNMLLLLLRKHTKWQ